MLKYDGPWRWSDTLLLIASLVAIWALAFTPIAYKIAYAAIWTTCNVGLDPVAFDCSYY